MESKRMDNVMDTGQVDEMIRTVNKRGKGNKRKLF